MEMNQEIFFLWGNNILLSFAAVLAIIVWVKTRESSWIFVILSVLLMYVATIYETLLFFGIFLPIPITLFGQDILTCFFQYIPVLLLIIALFIKAVKNMQR